MPGTKEHDEWLESQKTGEIAASFAPTQTETPTPSLRGADVGVLLVSMTRDELRSVASVLNVPRGKDKADTIRNLTDAIDKGAARVSITATIKANPANGSTFARTIFSKKLRTYKPAKVLVPVAA